MVSGEPGVTVQINTYPPIGGEIIILCCSVAGSIAVGCAPVAPALGAEPVNVARVKLANVNVSDGAKGAATRAILFAMPAGANVVASAARAVPNDRRKALRGIIGFSPHR